MLLFLLVAVVADGYPVEYQDYQLEYVMPQEETISPFHYGIMKPEGLYHNFNPHSRAQPRFFPEIPVKRIAIVSGPTRHKKNAEISERVTTLNATEFIMQDKADVMMGGTSREDLEKIMAELRRALEALKNEQRPVVKPEPITNNTSNGDLIKHISTSIETLMKTKSNETKVDKIKEVSLALDILLNRIARSAEDLIRNNQTHPPRKSEILAKIIKHMSDARNEAVLEKLRSPGVEVHSGEAGRPAKQEDDESVNNVDGEVDTEIEEVTQKPIELTTTRITEVTARQESESQSSEEGGGNLVANLISSFLGSLSKPDGGVDVDAIVGLVSGLSVQRDDGTFDFSGLTDLLQSFLGGDGDGGGGSDVGAFLGGLLGAIIQGSANPPGPQGTGRLTGNLLANILPGLSGPPPASSSEEDSNANMNGGGKKNLDSGSFLAGLLTSMLGASSGTSSGGHGGTPTNGGMNGNGGGQQHGSAAFFTTIKNAIFKSVFSIITSVLTSSSGSSSGGKH